MHPTSDFVELRGATARRWEGFTSSGSPLVLFVLGVAPEDPVHRPEIAGELTGKPEDVTPLEYAAETFL